MPTVIDTPIVILSEGDADKNFLAKLIASRLHDHQIGLPFPNRTYYSSSMFDKMLSALKGDGVAYAQLKGVIIIADSCDDPLSTFDAVVAQVASAGGFALPSKADVVASGTGIPSMCVTMLPSSDRAGGLETLFCDDLASRHASVNQSAEMFLAQSPAGTDGWNAEKRSKSHFATLVAATHHDDPSRAAAYAWREPPTVHIGSTAFDDLEHNLRRIVQEMMV